MTENYIVINGKRAELTEEQLRQLGIEVPKANPFERAKYDEKFYFISVYGDVDWTYDCNTNMDNKQFAIANYCTDKSLMEQRALHETLERLLWRYSMEHDGDKIEECYCVIRKVCDDFVATYSYCGYLDPKFIDKQTAEHAIEDIIKPFMKTHPEFIW